MGAVTELNNTKLVYANIATLNLLSHLRNLYGAINTKMMDANAENMTQPCTCGTSFVKLITHIEGGQAYAKGGNHKISDKRNLPHCLQAHH